MVIFNYDYLINMKLTINNTLLLIMLNLAVSGSTFAQSQESKSADYLALSIELLEAIKTGAETQEIRTRLESCSLESLREQLDTDPKKFVFWLNVYNAYIQLFLTAHPEYYEDRKSFFKRSMINLAGEQMSFADIEHGIIRRSQFEYFLGYVRNPFVARYKKRLRPCDRDYRIHFALNCGAKSCPPVRVYRLENLDEQLDQSATAFLEKFSTYDKSTNTVTTTPLFSWFRGDFKGKRGTKRILKKYGIVPDSDVNLNFDDYDWTLDLDNFVD